MIRLLIEHGQFKIYRAVRGSQKVTLTQLTVIIQLYRTGTNLEKSLVTVWVLNRVLDQR